MPLPSKRRQAEIINVVCAANPDIHRHRITSIVALTWRLSRRERKSSGSS